MGEKRRKGDEDGRNKETVDRRRKRDEDGEENKGRKKMKVDRLSALPDSLLIKILCFLDQNMVFKDVAKTSVLSKTWRSLWADLPTLRFYEGSKKSDKVAKFVSQVDKTLATRTAKSLEELQLNFFYNRKYASNIDAWFAFALESKVKRFSWVTEIFMNRAVFKRGDHMYRPPQMLYSSPWLEQLWLIHCMVSPKTRVDTLNLGLLHLRQRVVDKKLGSISFLEIGILNRHLRMK